MIPDGIDRDFAEVDPEALRERSGLLDEITLQALEALERGHEPVPLLAILVDVARLRLVSERGEQ